MWDWIELRAGEPIARRSGASLVEAVERAEAGEGLDRVASDLRLNPVEMVAALAFAALGGDGPGLVQGTPGRPKLGGALRDEGLGRLFPRAARGDRLALAAGLLQAHDFWEASHEAAQKADDLGERATSAYWHGIAHRREPDHGNAAYWFRRVGKHPLFETMGQAARPLLDAHGETSLADRLGRGGWDPFAFNDLCAAIRPGGAEAELARRLQRREMIELLHMSMQPCVEAES